MKKSLSFIRWKFVLPVAISLAAISVFFIFFFDPIVSRVLENAASKANGAKVDISGFHTSFLRGRLAIARVQVTDKEHDMMNTVEVGPMAFEINLSELVSKRLIIPEAKLDGIKFNTPRTKSGKLPKPIVVIKPKDETPGIADKLTEKFKDKFKLSFDGLKDQAKTKIEFDPKQLALNKQADVLKDKADTLPNDWKTKVDNLKLDDRLKKVEAELKEIQNTPTSGADALKTIPESLKKLKKSKSDLDQMKKDVQGMKEDLSSQVKNLKGDIDNLKSAKKKDVDDLLSRLNLDFANPHHIVESFIGPVVIDRVRTTLKYAQLAREHMPSKKEKESLPVTPRAKGMTILFPTPAALPTLWLEKASLSGAYTTISAAGLMTNLTTDPSRIGKPFVVTLNGTDNARQFYFNGVIDHVTDNKKASVDIQAKNLDVKELMTSGVFAESLEAGTGNLSMSFKTEGENGIRGSISLAMSGVKMNREKLMSLLGAPSGANLSQQDRIKSQLIAGIVNAVQQMPLITVTAEVTGNWENPDVSIDSNMVQTMTAAVKNSVGSVVQDQRKELEAKLDQILSSRKSELDGKTAGLQDKLNQLLGGLDGKVKDKINEASGVNLSQKEGLPNISNIKIPSLDKLFKK